MDATDSYQPGLPAILPDVQALDEVVVRSAFAQTTSSSYGTEVGLFLAEPGASWHGALSTANTGAAFSSTNLPAPASRGLVQQADQFRWFTRDRLEIGGPLTRWADFYASGSGQWASQTEPLATPGTDQRSRLLFGNARGRVRAGDKDQFDALYSGSRINLSDGGIPAGLEALTGNRMAPSFVLPGGFPGQPETDHLDFLQVGWTHLLPAASDLGVIEVRYGYSVAHLDTSSPQPGRAASSFWAAWSQERRRLGIWPSARAKGSKRRGSRLSLRALGDSPSDRCRWRMENVRAAQPLLHSFRYESDHCRRCAGVRDGVQHAARFP